jgi:hypothetical protein
MASRQLAPSKPGEDVADVFRKLGADEWNRLRTSFQSDAAATPAHSLATGK